MRTRIRPAAAADVPWMIEQLREFADVFPVPRSLFPDEEYARTMLRQLVDGPFWVADYGMDDDWIPIGFIGGMVAGHWMNPEIQVLTELLWWVAPAYRGTYAASGLLREFVEWGKANADWIICARGHHTDVSARAFERHGFHAFETNFLYAR